MSAQCWEAAPSQASRHAVGTPRAVAGGALLAQMPKPTAIQLAARFVAALYAATNGRTGVFRQIDDCAYCAGIKRPADVTRAVATAEAAGLIVVRADEPLVMLTAMGRQAAQPGQGGGR